MKKGRTKSKLSVSLNPELYKWLDENYENKSKYIEWLIYQDIKDKNLIKKELYIL